MFDYDARVGRLVFSRLADATIRASDNWLQVLDDTLRQHGIERSGEGNKFIARVQSGQLTKLFTMFAFQETQERARDKGGLWNLLAERFTSLPPQEEWRQKVLVTAVGGEEVVQDAEPLEDQYPVQIRYPRSADKLIADLAADSFPLTLIFKEYQVAIESSATGPSVADTFFVNDDGKVVVRDDVGVAAKWKDPSTDVCLHPGDWIIEANGVSNDPEGILRQLAEIGRVQVRVQQQGSIFKTDVFNSQDDMRNRLQSQAKPRQLQLLRQHATGQPLLCVCGGELQEIGLRERVYLLVEPKGENGVLSYAGRRFTVDQIIDMKAVTCDLCRKAVERDDRLWTCGNGANTILHAQSYDICQQCFALGEGRQSSPSPD
ncbi:rtcb [Symbiodinium natans]|uniref:Rtcb protein n=1 Tax=Symbiodinium natans TaxID=878477 RepID=A0A812MQ52_9DINO|nr:rtcb [Symbiodinium natans]